MRIFQCFICKGNFKTNMDPCMHYEEDEMDDQGEVSLCDSCSKEMQDRIKIKKLENEVSKKFFNCRNNI